MLFLFKYIDDLIGKGFEWYVILELLWYASATNVAMALPLAMLLSSIMTFGSLGENYELVAIKAAGISLQKAMLPLIILVSGLSISAFVFSDYMLPVANLKMGSLLYDVRNQKAAFLIEEGVFNNSIAGYSIRVQKMDKDGQTLHNILIYDHTSSNGNLTVIRAKQGVMRRSADEMALILKDGVRYEEMTGDKVYNPRQRFIRQRFQETEQKFDLSDFNMKRTDESLFKGNFAMLNLRQLNYYRDSTQKQSDSTVNTILPALLPNFRLYSMSLGINGMKVKKVPVYKKSVEEIIPVEERTQALSYAISQARSVSESLIMKVEDHESVLKRLRRYVVEYQRKFTLSFSCLVLFSIGAPLGAIIRKGGLGMPVVVSIIFFLIFHIISTIGEKSAKEGTMNPVLGMWIAIIVLSPLAAFLTYKAAVDSALFDTDFYKQFFQKLFKRNKK